MIHWRVSLVEYTYLVCLLEKETCFVWSALPRQAVKCERMISKLVASQCAEGPVTPKYILASGYCHCQACAAALGDQLRCWLWKLEHSRNKDAKRAQSAGPVAESLMSEYLCCPEMSILLFSSLNEAVSLNPICLFHQWESRSSMKHEEDPSSPFPAPWCEDEGYGGKFRLL